MAKYRNITLAIDTKTYREVRQWCAARDVSISRVVQSFLQDLPRLKHVSRFPVPRRPVPAPSKPPLVQADELDSETVKLLSRILGH